MKILEVSDYSWNPIPDNLKKQARICVGLKNKPVLVDINTQCGVGPAISNLDILGISHSDLLPSDYTTVVLQRGKKLHELPVLGQTETTVHHARGRTFRHRTSLNLERDAKAYLLKTLVIEKFPSECKFGILAGHNFLEDNQLGLDHRNAQIVSLKTFPPKTVIQYLQPDRQLYLRSHSLFWEKHAKPVTKSEKIVPPKSCKNCGTDFKPIKKEEKINTKFKKGEMVLYHGEIDHFPCTLGLLVRNYSNNHIIKAVYKKTRSKMILSVPECAVRRHGEDESKVIPCKYNRTEKVASNVASIKIEDVSIKTENVKSIKTEYFSKVDSSTQTPHSMLYPTEEPKIKKRKRRTISNIKSEFTECLYPFEFVENWVNGCPSQCSDVYRSHFEAPSVQNSPYAFSEEDNIPGAGYTRAKRRDAHDQYEYSRTADEYEYSRAHDEGEYRYAPDRYAPDEFDSNYAPDEYGYNAPDEYKYNCASDSQANYADVPDYYNRMVVLPDRMFKFHHNAKEEDVLGDAGGEEELRQSMTKQSQYDDDHPWPDHS